MKMRAMRLIIACALLCVAVNIFADDVDIGEFANVNVELEDSTKNQQGPFKFKTSYTFIGRSKVTTKPFNHEHIRFALGDAALDFAFYYNECNCEGLIASVGYTNTWIDTTCNPYLNQKHFNTATFALTGFSLRWKDWFWTARLGLNVDSDNFNVSQYAFYDLLIWGKYDYFECPDIHLHVGLIAQTGMKIDRVFPLLGFDYKYSKKLMINVIFPINISAVYKLSDTWTVSLGSRFIDTRNRASKNQPWRKAIVEYRTTGGELALLWEPTCWFNARVYSGSTIGGRLQVSDHDHRHKKRINFNASAYAGGEIILNF